MPDQVAIDKYRQAFQEEARDILVDLEATLLELNENIGDAELVSRAFRALHTIKGSGSMFGYAEVAGFTHNLENAFDEVRNGRLSVTPELVDLSLKALDHIKAMLDEASGRGTASQELATQILEALQRLTTPASATAIKPAEAPVAELSPVVDLAASETVCDWRITFAPGPDLLRNGSDPLLLLRELKQMGNLRIEVSTAQIPSLAELDPECCYMSWDMMLTTSAPREAIRDVFIFVEDTCELTIGVAQALAVSAPVVDLSPQKDPVVQLGRRAQDRREPEETPPFRRRAEDRGDPEETPPFRRRASDKQESASNIRVPTAKLDQFVDLVGELVTVQARLGEIASRHEDPDMLAVSEEVERLTAALRENSMSIRMLPIRATFERFRRLVHDLARDLHKEVDLTIEGADTELDKTVIDQLNDPLMHLIRNSMDHGIEAPAARVAAGKSAIAKILLSARHEGANVLICVADDGGGIGADAVRSRAIEKGLISADAQLSESEIFSLILMPGFSTAPTVTDLSGRGVGMDVVRQRVEALRGTIHISSKEGNGTRVTLRLPLTLAIIDGLLVRIGPSYFVLPLANTLECIELTREDIAHANGKHVAIVRGEIIPYIRLREYFHIDNERPEREQIMIAETEHGRCGFVVDEVLGDHQTVIKNLGRLYRDVQFISGATILGNGTLALILDPNRIIQDAMRKASPGPRGDVFSSPPPPAIASAAVASNSP